MGKVFVITSGKGGVGKTTTTANIGVGLSKMGYKTLLIDLDIGLRNLDILLGMENIVIYDLTDVIDDYCTFDSAIIADEKYVNLFLLPAAQTKHISDVRPYQILELCEDIKDKFDYILIDCPAGIDSGFENAVVAADTAIIIATPETASVRDADKVIGMIIEKGLDNNYLVINRLIPELVKSKDMLSPELMVQKLGIDPLGIILEDLEVIKSGNKGEPVILNDKAKAAIGYKNICKRIVGEKLPIMDMNEQKSFIFKLKKIFS